MTKHIMGLMFALTIVGGTLSPAMAAPRVLDRVVAVVNDDVILASELDDQVRVVVSRLREVNARIPPQADLERQVLERMIAAEVQVQLAQKTGIQVTEENLNNAISGIARRNGMGLDQFVLALEADGMNYADFREGIRREISMEQLRQRDVARRIAVTDREIDNLLENERLRGAEADIEVRLQHILIAAPERATPEQLKSRREEADRLHTELMDGADFTQVALSYSDGQNALQGGDLGWRRANQLPRFFMDAVDSLAVGDITEVLRSPNGFHILKLADRRGSTQTRIEETRSRHILIQTNALTSDSQARIQLGQLREQISSGADFAALAEQHSDDASSASRGGELGWLPPGVVVPEFQQAMDLLNPGETSPPFRSQFGWHIVQVLERRERDTTEESQRLRARQIIFQRKLEEETANWARQLRDEAYVEIRLNPADQS